MKMPFIEIEQVSGKPMYMFSGTIGMVLGKKELAWLYWAKSHPKHDKDTFLTILDTGNMDYTNLCGDEAVNYLLTLIPQAMMIRNFTGVAQRCTSTEVKYASEDLLFIPLTLQAAPFYCAYPDLDKAAEDGQTLLPRGLYSLKNIASMMHVLHGYTFVNPEKETEGDKKK